jgi:WhiB family transcriptional regulator, redox-sensing transcriptional regulator
VRAALEGVRDGDGWRGVPAPRTPGSMIPWQVPDHVELPCRREPELYFAENPNDLRQAKALCSACPMRAACLAGALERGEPWGVWGGEVLDRGRIIADKRPRGRPRKNVIAA